MSTEPRALEGVLMVQLSVGAHNLAARTLYERAGFETWGIEPKAMRDGDQWIDEAQMVKWLRDV